MSPVQVPADGGGRVPPDEVGDAAVPSRADGLGSRPHARSQPEQEQCNGSPKVGGRGGGMLISVTGAISKVSEHVKSDCQYFVKTQ